jgi:predicted PurR-regulated permease PerM
MEEREHNSGPAKHPRSAALPARGGVGSAWRFFFLATLFVVFLLFMWKAVPVLLTIFAGALIALGLRFISDSVSRLTRIPPLWSLTLVLILLAAGIGAGAVVATPTVWEQLQRLVEGLEGSARVLEETVRESQAGQWLIGRMQAEMDEGLGAVWQRVAQLFRVTFGAIAGFFLSVIVGLFLAYSPNLYISGFLRLIPSEKRFRASEIITELGHTLRWWMVGQLISMLILAVTTWVMLWLLGVPLAFVLGLVTGFLTFIPYLGPIIALVPILLIAFVEDPQLALWVFILYLIIQNIEANVIMPIIFKKTVHLPPVLTIVAQVLLGGILGFVGIVLATPLMAAGLVLVRMIYVQDVIDDPMKGPIKEMPD